MFFEQNNILDVGYSQMNEYAIFEMDEFVYIASHALHRMDIDVLPSEEYAYLNTATSFSNILVVNCDVAK